MTDPMPKFIEKLNSNMRKNCPLIKTQFSSWKKQLLNCLGKLVLDNELENVVCGSF